MATGNQFDLMLPLKSIASTKVAILLWNNVHCIPVRDFQPCSLRWQRIRDEIKGHIDHLQLPASLTQELNCLVKQICKQIIEWLEYHQEHFDICIASISQFCWTMWGTIDRRKTAQVFLKNEGIDAFRRFKLASMYCLETYIPILWNRLSKIEQKDFHYSHFSEPHMRYWSMFVKYNSEAMARIQVERDGIRYSLSETAFIDAAEFGNVDATKFFWFKLSTKERSNCLFKTAKSAINGNYGAILHFLLSQIDEKEQTELFKIDPFGVLKCFTNWPLHDFVLQALSCMEIFFGECDDSFGKKYYFLLLNIATKEYEYCDNCIYKELFTKLWKETPAVIKKSVLNMCEDTSLLLELLKRYDVRNIQLMLGEASPESKRKILLSCGMYAIFEYVDSNIELLELFLKECASSEDDVNALKQKLQLRGTTSKGAKIQKMLSIVCDQIQQQKHKRFKAK